MGQTAGIVAEMTKAFETANVEMFAISLPEARVIAATSAVMRKWNCTREEIVGKQLVKFGTGPLSARHLTEDTPYGPVQKVEVTYVPPLGSTRSIRFTSQSLTSGDQNVMMLIGQHASLEEAEDAIQNERRLSLALRSGGYAAWDHDYRTNEFLQLPRTLRPSGFRERREPPLLQHFQRPRPPRRQRQDARRPDQDRALRLRHVPDPLQGQERARELCLARSRSQA